MAKQWKIINKIICHKKARNEVIRELTGHHKCNITDKVKNVNLFNEFFTNVGTSDVPVSVWRQVSKPIFRGLDLGLEIKRMVLDSTWCSIGLVLPKVVSRPIIFRSLLHNVIIVFAVSAKCTVLLHPHRPQQHANKKITQVLKKDQQTKFYPFLSLCA